MGDRIEPQVFKEQLESRTREFSVGVFKMIDALPSTNSSRVITYQLGKSASSMGANYREANRAESRVDFGHKLQLVVKEAAESCYWLEILNDLYPEAEMARSLLSECSELRNLFQSIAKSVRTQPPASRGLSPGRGKRESNNQTI